MPILPEHALDLTLPKMIHIRQKFDTTKINDIEKKVQEAITNPEIITLIKPGSRIAIAVGSRGIRNLSTIVRAVGNCIKEANGIPFIVPAMGSHGGGTADGQKQILASMGIVEDLIGIPVLATMDVIQIGQTDDGVPVYMDKTAYQADMIVLINRVKPHTGFKGDFESGLCKMMAIGLGKHIGCSRLHQEGFKNFHSLIPSVAKVFLKKANIGFGIAILENAYDQTYQIKAIKANKIMTEEPKLLKKAKQLMPRIMVPKIDVLIIEKIGKDISGTGMDTNIIGRTTKGPMPCFNGPTIQQIVILNLTDASHGNACGVGLANFITKSMYDKIDHISTYANVIASGTPNSGRIPVIMNTEKEAIVAAIRCCSQINITNPRIVRISDTLHLETIWVSKKIYNEINSNTQIELC